MSWTLSGKRGAELSTDQVGDDLVEPSVREVFNSHLQENFSQIPREAGDIESEWTMFSASTVNALLERVKLTGGLVQPPVGVPHHRVVKVKLSIYRSVSRPTLTYGHEQDQRIQVDEMSFLLRVAGRSP
ncbi:hypothetical protein L3Q82_019766 [Scortum barcoo]|uniref:Uncharacterized protein n=1 Tax=Scortum barcoo TaxID=214431 RepID=A0ACB8VC49_9TELE|nr:hypothetical protein L3Q82_019766 [Scortum barcoo]